MSDEMQFLPEPPDGRWQAETTQDELDYWQDAIEDHSSEEWNREQEKLDRKTKP